MLAATPSRDWGPLVPRCPASSRDNQRRMPSEGTAIHSGDIGSDGASESTSARARASGSIRPDACSCNTPGTVPIGCDTEDPAPADRRPGTHFPLEYGAPAPYSRRIPRSGVDDAGLRGARDTAGELDASVVQVAALDDH